MKLEFPDANDLFKFALIISPDEGPSRVGQSRDIGT